MTSLGWFGIVRLGLVQVALGSIVVLVTSTLNRVMVVELALPAYHFFVGIPQLPVELLPEGWPVPRLVAALAAVREGWGAAAEAYVAEVVAEADRPRG